ncbi:MAG: hypothetical protein LCH30_10285 [Proteobacteria bacterium]|nr:hypothetical protein [Pseudomonadota bacterium]
MLKLATFLGFYFTLYSLPTLATGHLDFWRDGNQVTSFVFQQGDTGSITITNSGDEDVTNLTATIPSIWLTYFTMNCPSTLVAGNSCTLDFSIPTIAPVRTTRTMSFTADNADNSPILMSTRVMVVGGVKCWGLNLYGQLGSSVNHGTSDPNNVPTDVLNLTSGVVAVTTGSAHSCALLQTGDVQCWGLNQYGQLGTGTNSGTMMENYTPMTIDELAGSVLAISNGTNHSCALLTTGSVYCWGLSQVGQIGRLRKTLSENSSPFELEDLSADVILVSGGALHSCALLKDGTVKCWGWNYFGQLGNDTNVGERDMANSTPLGVDGLASKVVSISGGAYHTCALLDTGDIQCWGQNHFGQLGNTLNSGEEDVATPTPVSVQSLGSPALSVVSGAFHSCALLQNGDVKCWGSNNYGQLGNSSNSGSELENDVPLTVTGLSADVATIAAGVYHNCALLKTGTVECWGNNLYGQLGNSTNSGVGVDNYTPLQVQGLTNVLGLANHNFGYTTCVVY